MPWSQDVGRTKPSSGAVTCRTAPHFLSGSRDGPRGLVVTDQDAQAGCGSATAGAPVVAALGPEHPVGRGNLARRSPVPA